MGEQLLTVVKQVGIFMICAQMILHFKPAESYGKYIRLLMSIMVLVQLFIPVMEIFGEKGKTIFQGKIEFYDAFIIESMEEIKITNVTAEKLLEEMTMEEIKTRINNKKLLEEQEEAALEEGTNGQESAKQEAGMETVKQESDMETEATIQIDRIEVGNDD